jgi:5-methylcytosine-specific restriction endonuclease McrA
MKLELIFLLAIGLVMYDAYYGGILMKYVMLFKKYYKTMGIIFLIFSIYVTLKKNPSHIQDIFFKSNSMSSYLNKHNNYVTNLTSDTRFETQNNAPGSVGAGVVGGGGKQTTVKRSVSETKKKFIAYKQNWKCGKCNKLLNAWFEVDHKVRLEYGGDNQLDNLIALCRECHGEKTAMENM